MAVGDRIVRAVARVARRFRGVARRQAKLGKRTQFAIEAHAHVSRLRDRKEKRK